MCQVVHHFPNRIHNLNYTLPRKVANVQIDTILCTLRILHNHDAE